MKINVFYLISIFQLFIYLINGLYTKYDAVKELDSKIFKKEINKPGIWFVEFYAPWCGHCKALAPEWKKAAKALDGIVNIAAVDCDQHKDIAQKYGIQGFPTIKIFNLNKEKPQDYTGQRTSSGIIDMALKEIKKKVKNNNNDQTKKKKKKDNKKSSTSNKKNKTNKDNIKKGEIIELNDYNFDDLVINSNDLWLVEFFAPWCGHCKALAPEYKKVAKKFKNYDNIKIGAYDADKFKQKASLYQIKGFPTIKLFVPDTGKENNKNIINYELERKASALIEFTLEHYEKLGLSSPDTNVIEITNNKLFIEHCGGGQENENTNIICIIGFLPDLRDHEGKKEIRNNYINILENVKIKAKTKKRFLRFGWIEGQKQIQFEKSLNDLSFYPSIVAISLNKKRYVIQKGTYAIDNIYDFINGIFDGKEITSEYNTLPELVETKPWDGKDLIIENTSETASEDDDIMKELLGNTKEEL